MKPSVRITGVRKPFDPEAFAAVLVAAALARLAEERERGENRDETVARTQSRRKAS